MRTSGIAPAAAVLVTTVQSLRGQGEGSLEAGFANLNHHIHALRGYGVPIVVAINRFPKTRLKTYGNAAECARQDRRSPSSRRSQRAGRGQRFAEKVVSLIEARPSPRYGPRYSLEDTFEEKVTTVATRVYGAAGVAFCEQAGAKLARYEDWGFEGLPVCMAKTQYSLSDNPKTMGAPTGWKLKVNDVSLSAGAGFVVAVAGNMMFMPGLPSHSRASAIDVDEEGNIVESEEVDFQL